MATKTQLIIEIILFVIMLVWAAYRMNNDFKLQNFLSIVGMFSYIGVFILQAWMSVTAIFIPAGYIHNQVLFTLGIVFMFIGVSAIFFGIRQIGNIKEIVGLESNRLISSGVYHFTRHPFYVGYIFVISGLAIAWWNHYAVVAIITAMMMVYLLVIVEELHLSRQFGQEHQDYIAKTKRFL